MIDNRDLTSTGAPAATGVRTPRSHRSGYFFFRLLSTALLVAVPLVAIHMWTLYQALHAARETAYQGVRTKSETAAKAVQATFDDAQRLLTFLVGRDEIRNMDPTRCSAFLRGLEGVASMYAVVSVLDPTGQAMCVSVRGTGRPPASAGNSEWFERALASESFYLGKPAIGRITGKPVAPLSLAIRDGYGATVAIVVISIDLEQLEDLMVDKWSTPGGVLALIDKDFQFVIRSPDTRNWLGKRASTTVRSLPAREPGEIVEARGIDGIDRVFASTDLPQFTLRVAASMPTDHAFGKAQAEIAQGIAVTAAALLLAGSLAFVGARTLARPLRSLARTARDFAEGHEAARADESLPGEFKDLAIEMNAMHLARKTSETIAHASELRAQRLSKFYEAVSRTDQAIVRAKEPSELYATICDVCFDTGQASMAWIGLVIDERLVPVAWGGPAKNYTQAFDIRLDPNSAAYAGATVRALLDGKSHVANDYMNDPATLSFRENAALFDVRASAAVPFFRGGIVHGTLNLYAREVGFFNEEVMRLLGEIASDISFALDNFERTASHHRTSLELSRRESQLSGIVASATDAIVAIDAAQKIVVFNDAASRMFKIPVASAIGRRTDEFIPQRFRAAHARQVAAFAQTEAGGGRAMSARQLIGLTSDGVEFPVEVSTFRTFNGADVLITMIIRDVTREREADAARAAAAQSEAANLAKNTFLSRMSHELRTPLNAVLAFSQLLQEGAKHKLSDVEAHQLDLIFLAGAQVRALVDDLLDLSVIESGQLSMSLTDFELKGLLDGVLRMSEANARAGSIKLIAAYADMTPLPLHTDPVRLRQVVLNLVSNAIKYNRPGGSATIDVEVSADRVRISVSDTGLGMTEQQLGGLFEPYNRLGRERTSIAGTGIGMALVRQLVLAMGGRTTVDSDANAGTTVNVDLPLPRREDALLTGSEPATPMPVEGVVAPLPNPSGLVLYIEDNEFNVLVVKTVLRRWPDVQLAVAANGKSGLEQAALLRPDLILLDMGLPDISGMEVLAALQSGAETRDLRVVVLSATAMAHDVRLARAAGALDYWTKPIELVSFCDGMRSLLQPESPIPDSTTA